MPSSNLSNPRARHARPLRIGGASAFWGDSAIGPRQLALSGDIDFLVFDYLAETTMAIMAGLRRRDPAAGYATDFVQFAMKPLLPQIAAKGIRVVANAGGLNPAGCADALRALIAEAGLQLKVAVVLGDDVSGQLDAWRAAGLTDTVHGQRLPAQALSANAYLGAFPIAAALDAGADIVVTGRCVDSAVTLGPLIHHFGWQPHEFDRLSAGALAGHLIECACQATGGLHTDWQDVPDWPGIGYPVVECEADGRFAITKPPGTGGIVRAAAVAEQLLYEIGDPARYLLPDVSCDWRDVRIEQDGADRVRVHGARGLPPPATLKVSLTFTQGWRCAGTLVIIGIDAAAKARRTGEAVLARTGAMLAALGLPPFSATRIDVVGAEGIYGPHARAGAQASREVMLRVTADHPVKEALQLFAREVAPAGTSWSPGTTGPGGGRPDVFPVVHQRSLLCPREAAAVRLLLDGQELPWTPPPVLLADPAATPAAAADEPAPQMLAGALVEVPLVRLAWARSGDKGDSVNIGVIARRPEWLPALLAQLTPEAVAAHFAHLVKGPVRRYTLPGIHAMNFLLQQALDGGGTSSTRIDPLGKGFAQMLLDLPVRVPAQWLQQAEQQQQQQQ